MAGSDDAKFTIDLIVWADNLFLFSKDWDEWTIMFHEMSVAIHEAGLRWKPGDTKVLPCQSLPSFQEYFKAPEITWTHDHYEPHGVTGVEHLVALGVAFDRVGSAEASFQNRRGQGNICYFANKVVLRDTRQSPADRVRAFGRAAASSTLFGANGWPVTPALLKEVRTWERDRLR